MTTAAGILLNYYANHFKNSSAPANNEHLTTICRFPAAMLNVRIDDGRLIVTLCCVLLSVLVGLSSIPGLLCWHDQMKSTTF